MRDQWVLITGASGGFGIEFARQLEADGYRLILHGRDAPRLTLTLNILKKPDRHRVVLAELSARKSIENFITGMKKNTELTGLVNNAGFGDWGAFHACESVVQLDVLRTDLLAPVMLSHALMPVLRANHGFIINVSSLAGETPLPYMSTYAAAKAGMTYWSEAIRQELKDDINIVTLAPGPSPTGFRAISGAPRGKGGLYRTDPACVVMQAIRTLKQGGGYCVPGWRHRLLWLLQKTIPRPLALAVMRYYLKK